MKMKDIREIFTAPIMDQKANMGLPIMPRMFLPILCPILRLVALYALLRKVLSIVSFLYSTHFQGGYGSVCPQTLGSCDSRLSSWSSTQPGCLRDACFSRIGPIMLGTSNVMLCSYLRYRMYIWIQCNIYDCFCHSKLLASWEDSRRLWCYWGS
jgi:hypothetical protein